MPTLPNLHLRKWQLLLAAPPSRSPTSCPTARSSPLATSGSGKPRILMAASRVADPDPVFLYDPDPVCPERLDPDPVNIRPDPQP